MRAACLRKCISRVERSSASILVRQIDSTRLDSLIIMPEVSEIIFSAQVSLCLSKEQGTIGDSVCFLSPTRTFRSSDSNYTTVHSFCILSNPSRTNLEFIRRHTGWATHSVAINHTSVAHVPSTSSHCSYLSQYCVMDSETRCSNNKIPCYGSRGQSPTSHRYKTGFDSGPVLVGSELDKWTKMALGKVLSSSNNSAFICQCHSTNGPHSFIHLSPMLHKISN